MAKALPFALMQLTPKLLEGPRHIMKHFLLQGCVEAKRIYSGPLLSKSSTSFFYCAGCEGELVAKALALAPFMLLQVDLCETPCMPPTLRLCYHDCKVPGSWWLRRLR